MKCTSAAVKGMRPLSARACSAGVFGAPEGIPLCADCMLVAHPATPHARIPATITDRGCFLMIGPPPVLDPINEERTYARVPALASVVAGEWQLSATAATSHQPPVP